MFCHCLIVKQDGSNLLKWPEAQQSAAGLHSSRVCVGNFNYWRNGFKMKVFRSSDLDQKHSWKHGIQSNWLGWRQRACLWVTQPNHHNLFYPASKLLENSGCISMIVFEIVQNTWYLVKYLKFSLLFTKNPLCSPHVIVKNRFRQWSVLHVTCFCTYIDVQ